MGQDIALADINALRDGSQAAWDEDHLLHNWQDTYSDLSIEDITRSVFSMGVLIGWRAARAD